MISGKISKDLYFSSEHKNSLSCILLSCYKMCITVTFPTSEVINCFVRSFLLFNFFLLWIKKKKKTKWIHDGVCKIKVCAKMTPPLYKMFEL